MINIKYYNVGVVGATGLVGTTLLKLIDEYNFPLGMLKLFASKKSVGKEINFRNEIYFIEELTIHSFIDLDFVFFCAGSEVAKEWVDVAVDSGCTVIDNSSYFRMHKDVGLIIPEVNFDKEFRLISNPNCSTIQSVICLNALKKFGIKRVIYNTYQAVSGSGIKGINDLLNNEQLYFPYNINKTCIPQIDSFLENGYTKEEMKMVNETRKILNMPLLDIVSTCVRVPILNSHAVSVLVELEKECSLQEIKEELNRQEGLVIKEPYPTTYDSNGNDSVYIGRIRKDLSKDNSFLFFCVADNIRVGAASNALKIALKIIENPIALKN